MPHAGDGYEIVATGSGGAGVLGIADELALAAGLAGERVGAGSFGDLCGFLARPVNDALDALESALARTTSEAETVGQLINQAERDVLAADTAAGDAYTRAVSA